MTAHQLSRADARRIAVRAQLLDATADRTAGRLRVDAVHQDVPFTKDMSAGIGREIEDLASWLELEPVLPG
ncbi:hypothetical protein [Streptomyces sp. NPDC047061]|uniref:hypothetical protein n=1 Tax=Streptomyces sp. NPDC047061 TaxID=3154605 RepID=UPI0033D5F632